MKDRIVKVNELIKRELGQIILREVEMPEKTVATLTRVVASGNLQQAKVYISVVPDEKAQEVLKVLGRDIFTIQQILNRKLKMRPVPKILWVLEKATAAAQRIEEILDQIKEKG